MRTIHKHTLVFGGPNVVSTYEDARVVHVGNQRNEVTVWLEVDTSAPAHARHLHVIGTGWPVPPEARHVGSAILHGGEVVAHVYG